MRPGEQQEGRTARAVMRPQRSTNFARSPFACTRRIPRSRGADPSFADGFVSSRCASRGIDGVHSIVEKALHQYTLAGVPERFGAIVFPAGHSFPDDVKAEAYGFLDHWLT